MRCFICNKKTNSIHHINPEKNGGIDEEKNLISLCKKHHDIVEGVCSKCNNLPCSKHNFKYCWGFDDSLPPIHFVQKIGTETDNENAQITCIFCGNKNIVRKSIWDINIYKQIYSAIFSCNKCNRKFSLLLNKLQWYKAIDTIHVNL